MAKKEQGSVTVDQMAASINERIELLGTIKTALLYAFAGTAIKQEIERREQESKNRPVKRQKASRKPYRKATKGSAKALFMEILGAAGGPISAGEVYERLLTRRWKTISTNPRGLVGVTLRNMEKTGEVRHVGGDWELMPSTTISTLTNLAS